MALYAAYGSNMDPAHMLQRCPSSPVAGTGWLPGWRLEPPGAEPLASVPVLQPAPPLTAVPRQEPEVLLAGERTGSREGAA